MNYKLIRLVHSTYRNFTYNILPLPLELIVEASKVCNLKCLGCARNIEGTASKEPGEKFLSVERLKFLLRQVRPRVVTMGGSGEYLLNPEFFNLLEVLKGRRIVGSLITNGTLLTPEVVKDIENSRAIVTIGISISGIGDTFEKQRVGANFNKVVEAARLVGRSRMPLTVWCVMTRETFPELLESIKLAKEVKASGIYFLKPYLTDPSPEFASPDFAASVDYIEEVNRKVTEAGLVNMIPIQPLPKLRMCQEPFSTAIIKLNGDVTTCCHVGEGRRAEEYRGTITPLEPKSFIMGNILKEPLYKIWFGKRYRELRRVLHKNPMPLNSIITPEQLKDLRERSHTGFGYCTGCLYRWSETSN